MQNIVLRRLRAHLTLLALRPENTEQSENNVPQGVGKDIATIAVSKAEQFTTRGNYLLFLEVFEVGFAVCRAELVERGQTQRLLIERAHIQTRRVTIPR